MNASKIQKAAADFYRAEAIHWASKSNGGSSSVLAYTAVLTSLAEQIEKLENDYFDRFMGRLGAIQKKAAREQKAFFKRENFERRMQADANSVVPPMRSRVLVERTS